MPQIIRKAVKMVAKGLNLSLPPDLVPEGQYPRLLNANLSQLGELEARPGSTKLNPAPTANAFIHSIRRLNDSIPGAAHTHVDFLGAGTVLYSDETNPVSVDTGYSGNPLSLIPYRPDQSPEPWLYVGDANRMRKVNVAGTAQNMGILSPSEDPIAEIAQPLYKEMTLTGAGWSASGGAGSITSPVRVLAATTVSSIFYDSGSSGWACIVPVNGTANYSWLGPGERLVLNSGAETVTVESVANPITATTIASILYDSGAAGDCSIVLAAQSIGLERNSLININATETVRVLSVHSGPNGIPSIRCSTAGSFAVGQAVVGLVSFRCYTTTTIAATQTITGSAIQFIVNSNTGGYIEKPLVIDMSQISNRAVQPDDYVHLSVWLNNPSSLFEGTITMFMDFSGGNFQNYFYKSFRQNDLGAAASTPNSLSTIVADNTVAANAILDQADPRSSSLQLSLGQNIYTELVFKVSELVRVGTNRTLTLANINEIRIDLTNSNKSATLIGRFDSFWIGGTYGTDVQIGSPTGMKYRYAYHSSATGANSNPSPALRYPLFPSRQAINLTMTASTDPQVDLIEIERYDPRLQSGGQATWTYVATIQNSAPSYQDQSVAAIIAGNPPLPTNCYQPFPTLGVPIKGSCNVAGTSVTWVSGDQFPLKMVPGTVINIGTTGQGTAYQTLSYPVSAVFLELTMSAGSGTAVNFTIFSPVQAGQPLPILFGPLEGPVASYLFSVGDPLNPGTVYWTNGNDPDCADVANTIEVSPPSEPLVSGVVWNSLVYVFSRERVFILRPSFDALGQFTFTFYAIPSPCGLWSRWWLCAGSSGVHFGGRDGIYRIAGERVESMTDESLYPLFPHQGQSEGVGTSDYFAVDMNQYAYLRLAYVESDVYFSYKDTNGALNTQRFDYTTQGWFSHSYPTQATLHYWEETGPTVHPRLLICSNTGFVSAAGGDTDDGAPVVGIARTPSFDNGDPRTQKLYVDVMTDYLGQPSVVFGFNNNLTTLASVTLPASSSRSQARSNLSALSTLNLYRNICAEYSIPAGSQVFEFQPSYYSQPYLATSLVLRGDNGFPDWQVLRDSLWAIISTTGTSVLVDIDGRQTSYSIGSTDGALRKLYLRFQHASKGKVFVWQLLSADLSHPFAFFPDESVIRIKPWAGQSLVDARPWDDQTNVVNRALTKALSQ